MNADGSASKKKPSSASMSFIRRFTSVSCLGRRHSPDIACEASDAAVAASTRLAASATATPQPQQPETELLLHQHNQHHLSTPNECPDLCPTRLPPPKPPPLPPSHPLSGVDRLVNPSSINSGGIVARRPRTEAESEMRFIRAARALAVAAPAVADERWQLRPLRQSRVNFRKTPEVVSPPQPVQTSRGGCCRSGQRSEEVAPASVDSQSICEDETPLHAAASRTQNVEDSEESILPSSKAARSGFPIDVKLPSPALNKKTLQNGDNEESKEVRNVAELGTPLAQAASSTEQTSDAVVAETSTTDQTGWDSCTQLEDTDKIAFASIGLPDNHHQMSTTTTPGVSGVIECSRTQSFTATISTDILDRGRSNPASVTKPADIVDRGRENSTPITKPIDAVEHGGEDTAAMNRSTEVVEQKCGQTKEAAAVQPIKSINIVQFGPANKPLATASTEVDLSQLALSTMSTELFECVRSTKHPVTKSATVEHGSHTVHSVAKSSSVVERSRTSPPPDTTSNEIFKSFQCSQPLATTSSIVVELGRSNTLQATASTEMCECSQVHLPAAPPSINFFECAEIAGGPNLFDNAEVQDKDDRRGPRMVTTSPTEGFAPRVLETPREWSLELVGSEAAGALNKCADEEQLSIGRSGPYESDTTEVFNQRSILAENIAIDVESFEFDGTSCASSASLTLESLTNGDRCTENYPDMWDMLAAAERDEFRIDGDSELSPAQPLQLQVPISTSTSSPVVATLLSMDMSHTVSDAQADVITRTAESIEPTALLQVPGVLVTEVVTAKMAETSVKLIEEAGTGSDSLVDANALTLVDSRHPLRVVECSEPVNTVEPAEAEADNAVEAADLERGLNAALDALHAAKSSEAAEEEAAQMDAIFGAGTTQDITRGHFVLAFFRSFRRLAPAAADLLEPPRLPNTEMLHLTCFVKQSIAGGDLDKAVGLCEGLRQHQQLAQSVSQPHFGSQLQHRDDESCAVVSGVRLEESRLLWAHPTTCGLKFAERISIAPLACDEDSGKPRLPSSRSKQNNS